jgi:GT2 family glycosyltransferase
MALAIPTKNRPADLGATIESLLEQTMLPQQLIIVDQSVSDEGQRQVEAAFSRAPEKIRDSVELCYLRDASLCGLTSARNRSLALVRGDILLFLDDDVILEREFIEEVVRAYSRYPDAVGVGGIISNYGPPPRLLRWWERFFVRGPFHDDRQPIYWRAGSLRRSEPLRVTRLGGGLMSFRTTAIAGLRFDENLGGSCVGEDVEFCTRLGPHALLLIAPKARLVHKRTSVARSEESFLHRHARTMWYLYRKNWNVGFKNRVCLLWLNVGYSVVATLGSVHHRSFDPWRGLLAAIRESGQSAERK